MAAQFPPRLPPIHAPPSVSRPRMLIGMNKNHLTFTGAMVASALAGALGASLLDAPPQAVAQDAEKPAPTPAAYATPGVSLPVQRYQIVPLGERFFAILDTRTGRCWTGSTHGNSLSEYGVPAGAEK